jgi:hypothetical protein
MTAFGVTEPTARSSPMYVPRYPHHRMRVIHEAPVEAE